MPKRDWFGNAALALVAAACLVAMVAVGTGIVLEQYAKVHEVYSRYQEYAEQDRRTTSEEIGRACVGTDEGVVTKCVADKLEAHHRDQATNQDLQAQQDMAFWAFAVFVASCGSLIVTAFGIYYVRKSLFAAHDAVATAKQQLIADQRPWLMVVPTFVAPMVFDTRGARTEIALDVRNIGHTPAEGVYVKATLINILGSGTNVTVEAAVEKIRNERPGHAMLEATQLPGEERVERRSFRIERKEMPGVVPGGDLATIPIMHPVLIICVDYRVPMTGQLAQTMRAYSVVLKAEQGVGNSLPINGKPIERDRLKLNTYPVPGLTT